MRCRTPRSQASQIKLQYVDAHLGMGGAVAWAVRAS